jgi:hypothetical protein
VTLIVGRDCRVPRPSIGPYNAANQDVAAIADIDDIHDIHDIDRAWLRRLLVPRATRAETTLRWRA